MFDRKTLAPLLAVVLVASAVVPGAAAMTNDRTAQQSSGSAYAGTHVTFDTAGAAVVDYKVDGATVAESVKVQSKSKAKSNAGVDVGADLGAMTNFAAAAVSLDAKTEMHATVKADSGATVQAHDNGHGSLVVAANGQSQVVGMNLSESASVQSEGTQRVVLQTGQNRTTSVLVVGEGQVTANDAGNISAELEGDSRLVVRSYEGERSEDAKQQEDLITNGTAAAQVYVTEKGADVVDYGQETTVDVKQQSEGTVEMTVARSQSQGKVVITSVSEAAVENADDLQVTVDGEAAARASSYSALKAAADGGDSSKYMVTQSSSAEASADVMVALNHFSERQVTMQSGDGSGTDSGGDGSDSTEGSTDAESTPGSSGPGFTVVMALLAMAAIAGLAGYRS
ncbi:hypothetical protein ACKVMT_09360 [Halobacteriales archaeon Cl-PHB]